MGEGWGGGGGVVNRGEGEKKGGGVGGRFPSGLGFLTRWESRAPDRASASARMPRSHALWNSHSAGLFLSERGVKKEIEKEGISKDRLCLLMKNII